MSLLLLLPRNAPSGVPTAPPTGRAAVVGGRYTVSVRYYRANRDNIHLEEITDLIDQASIAVDTTQDSPMSFRATCWGLDRLAPYRDWIAPVMSVKTPNPDGPGELETTQQLGLYMKLPPSTSWTAQKGREQLEGRDGLWLLAETKVDVPYSVATGQNVGIAIKTICSSLSLRSAIQTTTRTMAKRRTWKVGTTLLQIANDLARSIGFVPLWVDRMGRVRSHRFRRLGGVEPALHFASAAGGIYDTIEQRPDVARLCNKVTVIGNDPKGEPVEARRINNDPRSPTSTVSLGTEEEPVVIHRLVEDPNIDSQDAADQLADRLMEQGTSVMVRMTVTTAPVLDWEIGDVIACDIETDNGEEVAMGRWRWERLDLDLKVDAAPRWTLAKLLPWAEVA